MLTLPRNTRCLQPLNANFQTLIKLGCFGSVLKSVKAQETPQAFSFYMVTIKGALDHPMWSYCDPKGVSPSKTPFRTQIFACLQLFKHFSHNISSIMDILVIFEHRISWGVQNIIYLSMSCMENYDVTVMYWYCPFHFLWSKIDRWPKSIFILSLLPIIVTIMGKCPWYLLIHQIFSSQ